MSGAPAQTHIRTCQQRPPVANAAGQAGTRRYCPPTTSQFPSAPRSPNRAPAADQLHARMAGERSRLLWAGLAASLVLQLLTLAVLVGHIREHHAPADDWAQAVARPHSRRRLLQVRRRRAASPPCKNARARRPPVAATCLHATSRLIACLARLQETAAQQHARRLLAAVSGLHGSAELERAECRRLRSLVACPLPPTGLARRCQGARRASHLTLTLPPHPPTSSAGCCRCPTACCRLTRSLGAW